MRNSFFRRLWFLLLFPALGGLLLAGCDSGGLAPDRILKNGVALSGSENADVAAVATHRDGEWLAAYSRERPEDVSDVVYSTADGDRAFIALDDQGRPSLAVTGPYVLTFGNYEGPRADIGLVNTESGTIETSDRVDLGVDFGSLNRSGSDSVDVSPAQATETAGHALIAFVCSAAAMPALDSPFPENACQASTLLQVATEATEQAGWGETAALVGWGSETDACDDDYGPSCIETLIDASGTAVEDAQAQIDQHEQDVARALVLVRFGGTWAYQDLDQSYFVIERDLSYDISYSNFGDCYFINRLELLGLSGEVFRYRVRRNDNVIRLRFDRVGADLLSVTRLGDGREFEWVSASSQGLQTFLDNECGSSSPGSTKTVSQ